MTILGGYFLSHRWIFLKHLKHLHRFKMIRRWVRMCFEFTMILFIFHNISIHNYTHYVVGIIERNLVSLQWYEKRQLHFELFLCHNGFCVNVSKGLNLVAFLFAIMSMFFKQSHSQTGLDSLRIIFSPCNQGVI